MLVEWLRSVSLCLDSVSQCLSVFCMFCVWEWMRRMSHGDSIKASSPHLPSNKWLFCPSAFLTFCSFHSQRERKNAFSLLNFPPQLFPCVFGPSSLVFPFRLSCLTFKFCSTFHFLLLFCRFCPFLLLFLPRTCKYRFSCSCCSCCCCCCCCCYCWRCYCCCCCVVCCLLILSSLLVAFDSVLAVAVAVTAAVVVSAVVCCSSRGGGVFLFLFPSCFSAVKCCPLLLLLWRSCFLKWHLWFKSSSRSWPVVMYILPFAIFSMPNTCLFRLLSMWQATFVHVLS